MSWGLADYGYRMHVACIEFIETSGEEKLSSGCHCMRVESRKCQSGEASKSVGM